jgi:hypothetical protein
MTRRSSFLARALAIGAFVALPLGGEDLREADSNPHAVYAQAQPSDVRYGQISDDRNRLDFFSEDVVRSIVTARLSDAAEKAACEKAPLSCLPKIFAERYRQLTKTYYESISGSSASLLGTAAGLSEGSESAAFLKSYFQQTTPTSHLLNPASMKATPNITIFLSGVPFAARDKVYRPYYAELLSSLEEDSLIVEKYSRDSRLFRSRISGPAGKGPTKVVFSHPYKPAVYSWNKDQTPETYIIAGHGLLQSGKPEVFILSPSYLRSLGVPDDKEHPVDANVVSLFGDFRTKLVKLDSALAAR